MKYLLAWLAALALLAATPYAFAQENCKPATEILAAIDEISPILDGASVSADKVEPLVVLAGVQGKGYDFVVVLKHEKEYGILYGFRNDNKPTICQFGLVPERLLPKFLAILKGTAG